MPSEHTAKEAEEYESAQESLVSHADTRSVELVRLNDESGNDDSRLSAEDSLDQEISPILVPHSQNMDPDSSIVASSQSIIPHSLEHRRGSTELDPKWGDLVVVYLRHQGRGRKRRLVTSSQSEHSISQIY